MHKVFPHIKTGESRPPQKLAEEATLAGMTIEESNPQANQRLSRRRILSKSPSIDSPTQPLWFRLDRSVKIARRTAHAQVLKALLTSELRGRNAAKAILSRATAVTALLVGIVSTLGAFLGSWLSSKATLKSSINALQGIDRQIRLQSAAKLAEFRQAWINGLREAMAKYQAHGAISDSKDENMRNLLKFHAEISLMMNRDDKNYLRLRSAMDCFLHAPGPTERFLCRDEFVRVCQDILKTEWDILKQQLEAATVR